MAAFYGAATGLSVYAAFKAGTWIFDAGVGAWCRYKDNKGKRTA